MSDTLQNYAWLVDLPVTRKIVLVSLADQANDAGESWPGLETICRRCSIAMRTLYEVLADLESQGWISRHQLPGYKTLYCINLEMLLQQPLLPPSTPAPAAPPPLRQPHPCAYRSPAGKRKATPAAGAPIKATNKSKAINISTASERDSEGLFEGHEHSVLPAPNPQAGAIAADLRKRGFQVTSHDPRVLKAVAAAVPQSLIGEFAALYPVEHPKSRGSPGYLLSAAIRQHTEPKTADDHAPASKPRESAAARALRLAREAEQRDRDASAGGFGDADSLGAHG